ncbi:hypothetical protein CCACVL1_29666 [Corchorus capsularis]|uniref:DUF569 domain-containing protein n=1 Tax=Corchorus capsularis TaxID=210143 RepID=A0A1R3G0V5_COCAP|nr:hypothetical protein CCACVL1_29666 [Corchorus capsularis]
MEIFAKAKAVKLRSHLEKYLIADDDQETVRQSRNGAGKRARWFVELVPDKPNVIRLRSCHGKYLTATDLPFLLGMTGKKVLQTVPENMDWKLQWEPIRDGFQVKLKTWCGKFLRANGGTPPWRNSVTHDEPHTGATQRWILWDVEAVQVPESESLVEYLSSVSSFSSISGDVLEALSDLGSGPQSPISVVSSVKSPRFSIISTGSPKLLLAAKQNRTTFRPNRLPETKKQTLQAKAGRRSRVYGAAWNKKKRRRKELKGHLRLEVEEISRFESSSNIVHRLLLMIVAALFLS